jgi:hypothetical protein
MNKIVAVINGLLNCPQIKISERNLTLNIPPPQKTTGAVPKWYAITQLGSSLSPQLPDLLVCRDFNVSTGIVTGSTDIYIAKTLEARQGLQGINQEFFLDNGDNITQTTTFLQKTANDASYGDNFRTVNDGTNTELQALLKRYVTQSTLAAHGLGLHPWQCAIQALDFGVDSGVRDPQGKIVTMQEVYPPRIWERYASQ